MIPGRETCGFKIITVVCLGLFPLYYLSNNQIEDIYKNTPKVMGRNHLANTASSYGNQISTMLDCNPGIPCEYENEVDFRVIVITQKRVKSLNQTLQSLQTVVTDGYHMALEIWIDRLQDVTVNEATYNLAKKFTWHAGPVRVNVQKANVGIKGQWIDTWRPKENTKEMALILEDDIDVSPYFFRWLRHARDVVGPFPNLAGYTLQDESIPIASGRNLNLPKSDSVFFYRVLGTWGFSPYPGAWRKFQDWFHQIGKDPSYRPYVPPARIFTHWYKIFERKGKKDKFWSMWYTHYCYLNKLWTLYSNLGTFACVNQSLVLNRKEAGLHYGSGKQRVSAGKLLLTWDDNFMHFPENIKMFGYPGKVEHTFNIMTKNSTGV